MKIHDIGLPSLDRGERLDLFEKVAVQRGDFPDALVSVAGGGPN